MNSTPKIFRAVCYLMIFAGGALFMLGIRGCDNATEPTPQPEQQRQRVVTGREIKDAELAADTLRYLAANKALQERLTRQMLNGKQKDRLIAQLTAKYRKTPTLAGCDTLVTEQGSRIDSLKAEVATHRKDSLIKADLITSLAGHVKDRNLRIDTLSAGWETANLENAKLQKKIKRRNRLIAIGAGVIAIFAGGVAANR